MFVKLFASGYSQQLPQGSDGGMTVNNSQRLREMLRVRKYVGVGIDFLDTLQLLPRLTLFGPYGWGV